MTTEDEAKAADDNAALNEAFTNIRTVAEAFARTTSAEVIERNGGLYRVQQIAPGLTIEDRIDVKPLKAHVIISNNQQ